MSSTTQYCPSRSTTAFWDVDLSRIDFEQQSAFVIEKVLNYGTWDDFVAVARFYGLERLKNEAVRAAYLKKDVLNFLYFLFDLRREDFVCYTCRQSAGVPWTS